MATSFWIDGAARTGARVLVLSDDRALGAWLAAVVLEPLGCFVLAEHGLPEAPHADLAILALGTVLAREELAPALARRWGIPVVALLGRTVEDEAGLVTAGVIPLKWPHAPLQVQEAVLGAVGVGPAGRMRPAPEAPRIRRGKDRRRKPEN